MAGISQQKLPVLDVLPSLRQALSSSSSAILSAEPGAGKTTYVPIALLEEEWLDRKKIIMLEPRRLAARRAAEFMSMQRGERVGQTVGYRIRGESRIGATTRLEIVTEGILTRIIQHNPDLPGIGLIIFDEFHERTVHADLGLALVLDVQKHLRPDLRILVMSATLNGLPLSKVLGDPPIIESRGRSYPVETYYLGASPTRTLEVSVTEAISGALRHEEGDILVFLPGRREIRRTESILYERKVAGDAHVHTLSGDTDSRTQDAAINRDPNGRRKIILSTSVAETSLTINGVKVIIDSGLARVPRFDPRRGMSGLVTVPVSQAVADQRRGRAGREAPGICFRLWTEVEHAQLPLFPTPEILASDLASFALDLALWGAKSADELRFPDPPPPAHLAQARSLLHSLGALDTNHELTDHGRAMAELPVHPRLAHMMIRGKDLGAGRLACSLASLLEERDPLAGRPDPDIDIRHRWHALRGKGILEPAVQDRISRQARRFEQILTIEESVENDQFLGHLLALAYPERVARRRETEGRRYLMVNGTGAVLPEGSRLTKEQFLAIGEVDGAGTEVRVFLAAPLTEPDMIKLFSDQLIETKEISWSEADESVVCRDVVRLGAVVVREHPIEPRGPEVTAALIAGVRSIGLSCLPWNRESTSLRMRSEWLRTKGFVDADWPDLSDDSLTSDLEGWLGPYLGGMWRRSHLERLPLLDALRSRFHYLQLRNLERLAPSTIILPSGRRASIAYRGDSDPVLAVPLQELFGQTDSPRIVDGRVRLLLHILSPARRPLAVTQDLRSFWNTVYREIRTQMRARYPKHDWPENPFTTRPSRRARSRTP